MILTFLFQNQLVVDIQLFAVHKATGSLSFIKVVFEWTDGMSVFVHKK